MSKTERIPLRVSPEFKKLLTALAKAERRSANAMIEVAVLDYIKRHKPTLGSDISSEDP